MLPVIQKSMPSLINDFFNDDLFDNFFGFIPAVKNAATVNIIEDKNNFRLEVAAPGLDKEDFKIDLHNDILTISAEKKVENENKDEKFLRREFSYCSFKRSFTLPEYVDIEKIEAQHKNGILKVIIPKKEEAKEKQPRSIKIS